MNSPWRGTRSKAYAADMLRFHEGEQVLVRRWFGRDVTPMPTGTVTRVYGASSMVYDYVVLVAGRAMSVRDPWLVEKDYLIKEGMDFID